MSLSAVTRKYVGSAVPAANTVEGALNALYTLGTSTTYYDGSGRTPGSGQAGTFARYQNGGQTEAVYATPASDTFGLRYIWAGDDAVHTPTMIPSPADTWATATVLFGLARNAGAYNAWDNAAPFTSGAFTGYARALALGSHTVTRVHLWEHSAGFYVIFQTAAGAVHQFAGEEIDPGVTNATSPNSAEATTGSRVCMYTNGGTTVNTATSWQTNTAPSILFHASGANSAHFLVLQVGGVTLTPIQRTYLSSVATGTSSGINEDGDFVPSPMYVERVTGNVAIGRLREMYFGPDAKIAQTASSGGTLKAFAASTVPGTDSDTLWLGA